MILRLANYALGNYDGQRRHSRGAGSSASSVTPLVLPAPPKIGLRLFLMDLDTIWDRRSFYAGLSSKNGLGPWGNISLGN